MNLEREKDGRGLQGYAALDQSKALAFRLNTAYTYEDNFQNAGYTGFGESLAVAPSLQYRPTDRLTVNVDAEIYQGTNVGKQIIFFCPLHTAHCT